jgi:hypothetical protein
MQKGLGEGLDGCLSHLSNAVWCRVMGMQVSSLSCGEMALREAFLELRLATPRAYRGRFFWGVIVIWKFALFRDCVNSVN